MNEFTLTLIICSYELIIRITPTKKNFSILDNGKNIMNKIHDAIDKIIPNVKKH